MKKSLKIILIVLLVLIFLWGICFLVDYIRAKNNKSPIFCILETTANDGGTNIYLGLGYKVIDFHRIMEYSEENTTYYDDVKIGSWNMKYEDFENEYTVKDFNNNLNDNKNYKYTKLNELPQNYSVDQAITDNCLVITNKIYNKNRLDEFNRNVSNRYENNIPDKLRILMTTIEGQVIITDVELRDDGNFYITRDYTRDEYSANEDRVIKESNPYSSKYYTFMKSIGNDSTELVLALYNDSELSNEQIDNMEKSIHIASYSKNMQYQNSPSFYANISGIYDNSLEVTVIDNEEEKERTSDKFSFGVDNPQDYSIGDFVKVTYTGMVLESYPAQIDVIKLEKASKDEKVLIFEPEYEIEKENIIDKNVNKDYDYNVYSINGKVSILINGEKKLLKDALNNGEITMEEIIDKAEDDEKNKKIVSDTYLDGGSKRYEYSDYVIIKCNTLSGNKDVYIGNTDYLLNE